MNLEWQCLQYIMQGKVYKLCIADMASTVNELAKYDGV